MATIQQIAEHAGVSRGTVDRALNNRGRIKPEVAEKIRKIAKDLNYEVKGKGRVNAILKKGLKIGVITQLSDSPFMLEVNRGIKKAESELEEKGISLLIRNVPVVDEKLQEKAIEELMDEKVAGMAVMPVDSDLIREKLNEAVEHKIPVVTFNSDIVGTKRSCFVGLDNRKSGYTAAGLMGMLTGGTGKILIITGNFSNSVNSLRVDGFIEIMKRDYPVMELVGVQSSEDESAEVEKIVINTLRMVPDLAGIFVVSSGQDGIRKALDKLELKKRPKVIVYDMTPNNKKDLEEGYFDFLIDQEGFYQGYQSLQELFDILIKGKEFREDCVYTDIKIKTKYN